MDCIIETAAEFVQQTEMIGSEWLHNKKNILLIVCFNKTSILDNKLYKKK
jgi:hypothetical protein